MLKKIIIMLLSATLLTAFTACSQKVQPSQPASAPAVNEKKPTEAPSAESITMKVACMYAEAMDETVALYKFRDILKEKSGGKLIADIYPNCQLGPEQVYNDSLIKGVVEMSISGTVLAKQVPKLIIGEFPFLFRDWDHAREVFSGPVGEEAFEGMIEKIGVRGFGFTPMGFQITASTDKPITKFEDLKNRRYRVPPIGHFIEFAKAIGTNPVPNMLTEFYTSLEQKVADCCIVPYSILRSSKVYELTPYITETNEIFFTHAWLVNEKFYQTLPADLQETLGKSIKEAQDILWDMAIETEKNDREFLKSQGIKIYQMDEEFKQKLYDSRMPVYEYLFQNYPGIEDLLKKIER